MTFSLVLCSVGRCDVLQAFFESLLRQGRADVEVILVDQNVDDRLAPVVAKFGDRLPLRHIRTSTRGCSRARNVGLAQATGDLIGFPDDDCIYLDGYLDRVAESFAQNPAMDGLTGSPTADQSTALQKRLQPMMTLDRLSVMNRCQEFTIVLRRSAIGGVRFNDLLGVGAGTPWGADEGPDFLIRVIERGAKVVFFPGLYVYHPDKIVQITPAVIDRASSYARGRGCFFRLHRYPVRVVATSVLRPAFGAALYLLLLQRKRSRYYAAVAGGLVRGLMMSSSALRAVRQASGTPAHDAAIPEGVGAHA